MQPQQFQTWLDDPRRPTLVMGVLNVTPDSFSDGGQFLDPAAAEHQALRMAAQGADLIDIGAESTRPGSQRVPADEQIRRLRPVLQRLGRQPPCVLSIDTTRAQVAQMALDHGVSLVNDISAGRDDPAMLPLVASRGVPVVLMHMRGQPADMQQDPRYRDVVAEVRAFLARRLHAARQAGVPERNVLLDPGIGFGKTLEHNLALLAGLPALASLGRPLLVGTSRKAFIGRLTGEQDPRRRLWGTAASVAWCAANGAAIVRVHDVEPMAAVVRVARAIALAGRPPATQL